jgi:hypothetical protein
MPNPRTQKQVAAKYRGNLNYFRKPHFFRTLRFLTSVLAIFFGVAGVVWLYKYGSDSFYNPGPISQNHASFKNDCAACHQTRHGNPLNVLSTQSIATAINERFTPDTLSSAVSTFSERLLRGVSFNEIDRSCLKCHVGHDLHQPDFQTMALRDFRKEIAVVHTESCSSCHREHVGNMAMKLPTSRECAACHDDASRMSNSLERVAIKSEPVSRVAITRTLRDGLIHFIPPHTLDSEKTVFKDFAGRHPDFEYETKGLRDPDVLKFNHRLHLGPTVGQLGGQSLDCSFCHKLAPEGHIYQQISFNTSCLPCHSLQFDPENPELKLPHGDVDEVRAFLRSLSFQYTQLAVRKTKTKADADVYVARQMLRLKERIRNGEDFERQIFYTVNPYKAGGMREQASFPGCAYCHEVKARLDGAPLITRPVMADRWLNHGRFTHLKHTQIDCSDCHRAAQSKDTADILMPSKASCAECHRPPGQPLKSVAAQIVPLTPDRSLTEKQRHEGGAPSECITCHTFHASPKVAVELRAGNHSPKAQQQDVEGKIR